jgi:hypothetical protein
MQLKEFVPDPDLFLRMMEENQVGHGPLGRYRGAAMQNGAGFVLPAFLRTIFAKVARFAAPIVRSAAPHAKAAIAAAKPHLAEAGKTMVSETAKTMAAKLDSLLASATTSPQADAQTGQGRKRRRRGTKAHSTKHPKMGRSRLTIKKLRRISPSDYPDAF